MGKKREVCIDVLRVAACLNVIFNHTQGGGFYLFASREPGSALYWTELFASIGCKFAVPVFFAISGALLLEKKETLGELFARRIARIAAVLLVFSAAAYAAQVISGQETLSVKGFVLGLYDREWNYAYWYLYAYLAFLLISPALGALARGMDSAGLGYVLALALVLRCVVPGFEALHWEGVHSLNRHLNPGVVTADIVLYPLMGYYVHRRLSLRTCRRAAPVMAAAALAGMTASCLMSLRETLKTGVYYMQMYHELFAPLLCAAVLLLARAAFGAAQTQGRGARIVSALAGGTFGVYLLHPFVLDYTPVFTGVCTALTGIGLPALAAGWLACLPVFALCFGAAALLRCIPGIRWLLG